MKTCVLKIGLWGKDFENWKLKIYWKISPENGVSKNYNKNCVFLMLGIEFKKSIQKGLENENFKTHFEKNYQ